MSKKITVEALNAVFAGKKVTITSTSTDGKNPRANKTVTGICKKIHAVPGSGFDIELENSHRYGFSPATFTDTFAEGSVSCRIALTRKIELAD